MYLRRKAIEPSVSCSQPFTIPGKTSVRPALQAFDAFVDGVVEEIGQLKAALKDGSEAAGTKDSSESIVLANASPDVVQLENDLKRACASPLRYLALPANPNWRPSSASSAMGG